MGSNQEQGVGGGGMRTVGTHGKGAQFSECVFTRHQLLYQFVFLFLAHALRDHLKRQYSLS